MKIPFTNLDLKLISRQTPRTKGAAGVGYDAVASDRTRRTLGLMAGIMASADRHLTKLNLGKLREMCRAHDRQGSLFSGLLDRAQDNIFGANFDFIPNTGDTELNKKAKDYITARMEKEVCDATGVRDFAEIAKTGIRALWNDGDFLLTKRKDGSVLAFEADQVETPSGIGKGGKRIVLGVEMNDVNRHVAYWVKQRRTRGDYGMTGIAEGSTRVPGQYALLPAYRKRFNQTRGVPFLAAALSFYDRTNNYLDYESLAAELNAMMGYKIKKTPTEADPAGGADNDDTASTYDKLQKIEPGMIFELLPGEDVDMIGTQRPGENFEPYIVTCCRIIGVAVGFPLELMMLDFSKTNYSSARASLGEARRMFRGWQKFSQNQICLPWYRWQMSRAIATGLLPARPEVFSARCQWPAWEYIDPLKEAKGNQLAISNYTKTPSQCIREIGGEPDEVFEEIRTDKEKIEALGLKYPSADNSDKDNQKNKEDEDEE